MKAKVYITLKSGVHDPQGEAVQGTLAHLGFDQVSHVRIGKYVELDLDAKSIDVAKNEVESMCERLLANPVIEQYRVEVIS